MSEVNPPSVEEPAAGPSGVRRKRARSTSNSSSGSSSNSSSSSSAPSPKRKRARRRHNKKSKRSRQSIRQLRKQISELQNAISQPPIYRNEMNADQVSICSRVSGDLYEDDNFAQNPGSPKISKSGFTFDIETKLKEPSVPKAPENYIKMLADVQHFNNNNWSEVRYADTQKLYNHTPGFVDLETNGEIRQYDL